MDIVVDYLEPVETSVAAHQVGAAELVVAMDQGHGPAQLGGHMEGEGGLTRPRGAGEVDRIAHIEIGQCPLGELVHHRGQHETWAGFRHYLGMLGSGGGSGLRQDGLQLGLVHAGSLLRGLVQTI